MCIRKLSTTPPASRVRSRSSSPCSSRCSSSSCSARSSTACTSTRARPGATSARDAARRAAVGDPAQLRGLPGRGAGRHRRHRRQREHRLHQAHLRPPARGRTGDLLPGDEVTVDVQFDSFDMNLPFVPLPDDGTIRTTVKVRLEYVPDAAGGVRVSRARRIRDDRGRDRRHRRPAVGPALRLGRHRGRPGQPVGAQARRPEAGRHHRSQRRLAAADDHGEPR